MLGWPHAPGLERFEYFSPWRLRARSRKGLRSGPRRARAGRASRDRQAGPSVDRVESSRDPSQSGRETRADRELFDAQRVFPERPGRKALFVDAAYALSVRDPFAEDHRFHRIEVSVNRAGVALRYRRGYRVLDTRESLVQGITNRLQLPADENPLGVRLQLDSLGKESGNAVAEITVAYPAPPQAGGRAGAEGSVRILGVCAVRNGRLSDPIDLSGRPEQTRIGDALWLVRSGRVSVKPGSYRWSFAVRDDETGITSFLTFDRALP